MNLENVYSFVFKGLLTEQSLDGVGRKSKKLFQEESYRKISERLCLNLMDDQLVTNAKKMAVAYTAISAFENSVRAFVSKKLSEEKGVNWWDVCVSEKIRHYAKTRMETEQNIKWHVSRGNEPINFIEFGDLISIMSNNWPLFEPHIHEIDWAKNIITSLERSRNVIMHSGELSDQDLERVGMYIRDWIRQVG